MIEDRHASERLSDNTGPCYEECKDCKKRSDGTVWSNSYRKGCCAVYKYPLNKPMFIKDGSGACKFYEAERDGK